MSVTPPLLIDTTSLLRADLDRFQWTRDLDRDSFDAVQSLILFERILLDGPSIKRNSGRLQWLSDIHDGIEILNVTESEQTALYRSSEVLARQMHSTPDVDNFMFASDVDYEVAKNGFRPSTRWKDLQRELSSEDLRRLHQVFSEVFAPNLPFHAAPFVTLARTLYYLCLQESVRSSLLLDPLKALEMPASIYNESATRILDMFDNEVGTAFRARKEKWLGPESRTFHAPLLAKYIQNEAKRRGWSIGRVILWMRESREVQLFRKGLGDLQQAVDSNDSRELDAIFADLDAAAAAWSKQLGVDYKQHGSVGVSVSLPFVGIAKELPLPRLFRHSASSKLLIFVGQLIAAA